MSAVTLVDGVPAGRSQNLGTFVADTLRLTRRSLLLSVRMPQLIVLGLLLPTMFVLLFRYVFGGAIFIPGYHSYVDYLIPGIVVQTALFGGSSSAVAVADDLTKGVTDRFRSLPTSRGAILAARTLADAVRLAYTIGLIIGIGVLVGFRFHNGWLQCLAGAGLGLLFGYAASWIFTLLGLLVRSPETAAVAGSVIAFPLVFAASTFTSTASMPYWLRAFAERQPVSYTADAIRGLMEGTGPVERPALYAVAWAVGLIVVAATLSTWRFKKI
ncbi:MAG: oleandomycin transport system permease protein [Gaiellaceae bacterium]|jgi:ABC transporter DrrB family efflux protein|nr:oleandomycin transport system permease protein [Gaiellaceae bacterium]